MKACVNALIEVAEDALETAHNGTDRSEIQYVLNQSPVQCLAEHDAEVIDQFIKEIEDLGFAVDTGYFESAWVIDIDRIKNRANQLRQKAHKEVE